MARENNLADGRAAFDGRMGALEVDGEMVPHLNRARGVQPGLIGVQPAVGVEPDQCGRPAANGEGVHGAARAGPFKRELGGCAVQSAVK